MKLPKEQYLALKKFKKKVREENTGKIVKDKQGHLYKVNADGSIRRLTGDDLRNRLTDDYGKEKDKGPAFGGTVRTK